MTERTTVEWGPAGQAATAQAMAGQARAAGMDRAFNPWRYGADGSAPAVMSGGAVRGGGALSGPDGTGGGPDLHTGSGAGGAPGTLRIRYPALERAADTYPLYDRLSRALREVDEATDIAVGALKAEKFSLAGALDTARTSWSDRGEHLTSAFSTLQSNLYAGARGQRLTDDHVEQAMADVATYDI